MTITVRYQAVDGYAAKRKFQTLAGAQKYAADRVGETPDLGTRYAVSFDGVGKVEVLGATLVELFPKLQATVDPDPRDNPFQVWVSSVNEDRGTTSQGLCKSFASYAAAAEFLGSDEVNAYDGAEIRGATLEAMEEIEGIREAARIAAEFAPRRWPGCTCSDMQLTHVGCDCEAERF